MRKFNLKNKFIILILLIFLIVFYLNSKVLAISRDWSAVWEETELYGGGKAEYNNMSWDVVKGYINDAVNISDEELSNLSNEDRLGYIKFLSAFIGSNTALTQNDDVLKKLYQSAEQKVEKLKGNTDLSSEEKTLVDRSEVILKNYNDTKSRFSSFEDFLENASTNQIIDAKTLGGFFDQSGNVVYFTEEQNNQLTDKLGDKVEESNEASEEIDNINKSEHTILDRKPIGLLPEQEGDGQITVDDTIDGAMDFVNRGDDIIVQDRLQETIGSLYNVLLVIAMVVAVVTGLIIAIKFMTSSVEGKAEVKKTLVPYVISCAVTFGAFGIWKLVVEILNNLE